MRLWPHEAEAAILNCAFERCQRRADLAQTRVDRRQVRWRDLPLGGRTFEPVEDTHRALPIARAGAAMARHRDERQAVG